MLAYAASPLRLLVAPPGSGKTTIILRYIEESAGRVGYCCLPPAATVEDLHAAVARALNNDKVPQTYQQFEKMVCAATARGIQLAVDDADNADADALAELHRLLDDVPLNASLIYSGKSRDALRTTSLVSRGVADLCDAKKLFFTPDEAGLLAEKVGVEATDPELQRLIEDTDGWALAVSHTIRRAAAEGETITRAFSEWRADSKSLLADIVAAALIQADDDDRSAFEKVYAGQDVAPERLRKLEANGLFVLHDNGMPRIYRALRLVEQPPASRARPAFTPPLMISMFRSFEASIQGRTIPWVRRRDQDIIKYLLLKRTGSATRDEIAETFWPNVDRHLATQSVRTACSTIRRAIGAVVGPSFVDSYFRTTPELQIGLDNVVCDVRRFVAHFNDGEAALQRCEATEAEMHLRASYKLYRGRLLEFEGDKNWFAAAAATMHERHLITLERLAELALDRADSTSAQLYLFQARAAAPERTTVQRLLQRLSSSGSSLPMRTGTNTFDSPIENT
ncbi:MAG: AAA family ATPase [Candidatus Eremiobacteraeota bacterium]|nr:AAA family ATPase [Candidatus Eremiobacteraeota bacterium]